MAVQMQLIKGADLFKIFETDQFLKDLNKLDESEKIIIYIGKIGVEIF